MLLLRIYTTRRDAAWPIEALHRAFRQRQVAPDQLLLHTDQGSHDRAIDDRNLLRKWKIVCSVSSEGCCWDNAVVESFCFTLQLELDLEDNPCVLISAQLVKRPGLLDRGIAQP